MFEVSLTDARADEMHPVFANLFVTADWDPQGARALFSREHPRVENEEALHAVHFIALSDDGIAACARRPIARSGSGRNREASRPLANFGTSCRCRRHARTTGLDPIAALSMQLLIPRARVGARDRSAPQRRRRGKRSRYSSTAISRRWSSSGRAMMSTTLSAIRMREMRFQLGRICWRYRRSPTMLMLLVSRPQSDASVAAFDRRALWRFGISGDRPLIVVEAGTVRGIGLVRSLARALRLWSWGGVACDLVVIDSEPSSYRNAAATRIVGAARTVLTRRRHRRRRAQLHVARRTRPATSRRRTRGA